MEKLTAKLVYTLPGGRQRFYKLNKKITRGKYFGEEFDIPEKILTRNGLKDEYKFLAERAKDGIDLICISDALTHTERLVFDAFEYEEDGKVDYSTCFIAIDGKNTMMIDGGDPRDVYEPEVYIRHLAKLNGYEYGGLV